MSADPQDTEERLIEELARCYHDPLRFVMMAFPWGSGELKDHDGPDTWQRDVLIEIGERLKTGVDLGTAIQLAVASGHGVGKALAHGEPVLTPMGWIPIEQIALGDEVISADGTTTKVVGVYPQGERECFRVITDDGCSVIVDGDHQWLTTSRSARKHSKPSAVRTTKETAASLTFPNGPRRALNHSLPAMSAAEHPQALLPVEPYILGCWLGDGDSTGRLTGEDEIFECLVAAGANLGTISRKPDNKAYARYLLGVAPGLRVLSLHGLRSHEKFIPRCYLHGSVRQRVALLQGLLDTDGTVGKNCAVVFDITSRPLADGISELVRSLGGVARRGEKWGSYYGKRCRRVYRIYISLPKEIAPFRLPAKAAKYHPSWGKKNCDRTRRRFIAAVEPVGIRQATCIQVAHPSKLFVTRDHIVTHNSACVSWLILFAMSTMPDTKGVVTANTEVQLRTKTWAELAKWHRLCICKHWFTLSATAIYSVDPDHERTWRVDKIAWSEENTEAFAGLHNQGRRILLIFDEASSIPDIIWETSEGAMTDADTEIIWAVFGNPTRNTGRFRECFGKLKHRWITRQVDSRTARLTSKKQIAEWVADYGEDSDFVRIRVRGTFPRVGSMQLISTELVDLAMSQDREPDVTLMDPVVMGVDVARFGDDASVIVVRRGRDARSFKAIKLRGVDTMTLAARVVDEAARIKADAIFVDGGGVGGGVVDRLRALHQPVYEVQFGGKADRSIQSESGFIVYANKRAEMWGLMRDWLKGGMLPLDNDLAAELTSVEYGYVMREGRDAIQLEKKEDMRRRGLSSPDHADALGLTFAYPVQPSDHRSAFMGKPKHQAEYNPMQSAWQIPGQPTSPQPTTGQPWMPHNPYLQR